MIGSLNLRDAERAYAALGIAEELRALQLALAPEPSIEGGAPALILDVRHESLPQLHDALSRRYPSGHVVRLLPGADGRPLDQPLSGLRNAEPFAGAGALYVAALPLTEDVRRFDGLVAIVRRLRDPEGGCPWDLAQTHESLKPHLLEEAYEALSALDRGDRDELREELGDLLLQVLLHARIAEQAGEFETNDVVEGLARKLLRRHPHVFGAASAGTAAEVERNWDVLKRAEKGAGDSSSALGGVPAAMPALAYAQAILGRAERAGFAWPAVDDVLAKVAEEAAELADAPGAAARREELGDLLWTLVALARRLGLDAEEALRLASAKFGARFQHMESAARERRIELRDLDAAQWLALWDEAKGAHGVR